MVTRTPYIVIPLKKLSRQNRATKIKKARWPRARVANNRLHVFASGGNRTASCSNVTANACCPCENCQHARAARALHPGGPNCHLLSSLDADRQAVIAAWRGLTPAIRKATLALIGSQKECTVE